MKIKSVFLWGAAVLLSTSFMSKAAGGPPQGTPTMGGQPPMTEKEVISELKKDGPDQLLKDLQPRGVTFEMDQDTEKRLRKNKATDQVIQAVTQAGPKEREAATKALMASGGLVLSPAETSDFNALQAEQDPDKAIAEAEAYTQKYPKSDALSYTFAMEANAYENKGNPSKAVEFGEKSLQLKKDNLMSLLIVAYMIPTPQYINLHKSDEDKQLDLADGYAQDAMKAVDALKKGPTEQDADFTKRKNNYLSNLHSDLGMIHLDRAQLGLMGIDQQELAKSQQEYNTAVSLADKPEANDYYRLGEVCRLQGKIDDAIAAFTKASQVGQGVVKEYAQRQVQRLQEAKAQAGKH